MIFCVWANNAQTPCTIKSNTFNHRMLKPKGKDKIRNVTGTGRTMNWQRTGWKSRLTHQTKSAVLVTERNVKLLYMYSTSYLSKCAKWRGTYIISFASELPEGLNVEPGALVPSSVQRNPHGVLLKQSGEALVHCQVLVTLNVQELREESGFLHMTAAVVEEVLSKSMNTT